MFDGTLARPSASDILVAIQPHTTNSDVKKDAEDSRFLSES